MIAAVKTEKYMHTKEYSTRSLPCDSELKNSNRVRNSVQSLKTCLNNSEVELTDIEQSGKNSRVSSVFVLNMRGKPLDTTTPCKARHLLKKGDAHVKSIKPFVIQMNKATGECTHEHHLG